MFVVSMAFYLIISWWPGWINHWQDHFIGLLDTHVSQKLVILCVAIVKPSSEIQLTSNRL